MTIPPSLRDRLRRPRRRWLWGGLALAITGVVFFVFNDNFTHREAAYDETFFVWGGWSILKGLVPYRDFLEFKPPMLFLTEALALKLYGYGAYQYRWFFMWFPMLSVLALQASMLSRRIGVLATAALGLALVQLWVNLRFHDTALSDSESVGLAYYFLGVACLLGRTRLGDRLKILGGVFLTACILSKEPFLPSTVATGFCCYLADTSRRTWRRDLVRHLKLTGTGFALVVLGLCIWMVPSGAMKAYVETFSKYMRLYRDPARSYCVALGRVHPTTPLNDLWRQAKQGVDEYVNLKTLGYLLPFAAVGVYALARKSWLLLAATLGAVALAFYSVTASNCQWMHYYLLSQNGLFFGLVLGLDAMTKRARRPICQSIIGLGLLASAVMACWPRFWSEWPLLGTRHFQNPYREQVPGSADIIAEHTTPADRVFTTGPPVVYLQSDRVSSTRESGFVDETMGFYDGNTDEERLSGIRAELESHPPKVFLTDPENAHRKVRHMRAVFQPFLAEHHYREVVPNVWLLPD